MKLFGAVEAGGTKFVCAAGTETGEIKERISIPTTTPEETMPEVIAFLKNIKWKQSASALSDQLM